MRILILFIVCLICSVSISAQGEIDLFERIETEDQLGIFTSALEISGWKQTLQENGPFTVFAPTDEAFSRVFVRLDTTQEDFFADAERLYSLLSFHIVSEARSMDELQSRSSLMPLRRSSLVIELRDGELLLNQEARILSGDLPATNGWLHIVDTVLLAPGEFAIAEADNASYLRLGLVAVLLILLSYLASFIWRWRMVDRETQLIQKRLNSQSQED